MARRLVPRLDVPGLLEGHRVGAVAVPPLGRDRFEEVPGVVAEGDPLQDPADHALGTVLQQRYAAGPGLPVAVGELVHLVARLATEELDEVAVPLLDDVHAQQLGALGDAVGVVAHREAGQHPRRVDAHLAGEADQAAGALGAVSGGHHEHRVVEPGGEPVELLGGQSQAGIVPEGLVIDQ
jgi:hypothetical protein